MTLLASVRRHSLRVQQQLHRWSICATDGSHLLTDSLATPVLCVPRSRSCLRTARSWRSDSSDSAFSAEAPSPSASGPFTVVLLGDVGVGKTALASIFAGAADSMESDSDLYGCEMFEQSMLVDGESARVTLLDMWDSQDGASWRQGRALQDGDAYIVVYSITDRTSFLRASELRIQLRRERQAHRTPIILVGNKCDLVRRREVSVNEGRACAMVFDCKFIETSAAMQHNVWPLFEGVVRQLRLRRDSAEAITRWRSTCKSRESIPKKAKRFIDKLVAKKNKNAALKLKSKSCHDLSVL
ncbi:GTP-binding protein GEM [Electrophorus electricus]|uniref:GTP-binding protein n=2 Tax=Electrophorus TaxID=8004 RepID=A0A4W4GYM8_ELEEL|nr:GTP-binding protein GEM [Electrophorus electricus]